MWQRGKVIENNPKPTSRTSEALPDGSEGWGNGPAFLPLSSPLFVSLLPPHSRRVSPPGAGFKTESFCSLQFSRERGVRGDRRVSRRKTMS
jgi:hypothetical protein